MPLSRAVRFHLAYVYRLLVLLSKNSHSFCLFFLSSCFFLVIIFSSFSSPLFLFLLLLLLFTFIISHLFWSHTAFLICFPLIWFCFSFLFSLLFLGICSISSSFEKSSFFAHLIPFVVFFLTLIFLFFSNVVSRFRFFSL